MDEIIKIPSDPFFKSFFNEKDIVKSLLEYYVPSEIHRDVVCSSLELFPSERVTDKYRLRFEDMVWKAQWKDSTCFFFIAMEFQSSVSVAMPLRIACYSTLLLQDLVDAGANINNIPPIFPIVVYNGKEKWTAPTSLQELRPRMSPVLQYYQTQQNYFLIDIKHIPEKDIVNNNCIASDFFRLDRMEHLDNIDNFHNIISRIIKNLKGCSDSLYSKFFNAVKTDLLSNHILANDSNIESLEEMLEMEQSIRLEYFKDRVAAENTAKFIMILNNLIADKFKSMPDYLKNTLSKINDPTTIMEVTRSIDKFDDARSLNSFIEEKISHTV